MQVSNSEIRSTSSIVYHPFRGIKPTKQTKVIAHVYMITDGTQGRSQKKIATEAWVEGGGGGGGRGAI